MQPDDIPAVVAIELQSFPDPWGAQILADCINVGFNCHVLQQHHEIIGYAISMHAVDECELLSIAITPTHRHQGMGQYFLQQLLLQLAQSGIKTVLLEARKSNIAAIKLYETLNFERNGIRPNYYRSPTGREDAILFKKTIAALEKKF